MLFQIRFQHLHRLLQSFYRHIDVFFLRNFFKLPVSVNVVHFTFIKNRCHYISNFWIFKICFRNLLEGQLRWLRKRKILEHSITFLKSDLGSPKFLRRVCVRSTSRYYQRKIKKSILKSWNLWRNEFMIKIVDESENWMPHYVRMSQ